MSEYVGKIWRHESSFSDTLYTTWSYDRSEVDLHADPSDGTVSLMAADWGYDGERVPLALTPDAARALAHDLPLILIELALRAEGKR